MKQEAGQGMTGVCSSVAVAPCGALGEPPAYTLSVGPNWTPRLCSRAAAFSTPDERSPGPRLLIRQPRRRVTEVLDLRTMWALLQVLLVWCMVQAGRD